MMFMKKMVKATLVGALGMLSFNTVASATQVQAQEELSVWIMGDGNENTQAIFDGFTAETGIATNVQSIPWSAVHDRLLTAVASGEGPDVIQMGSTFMAEFVDAGALMDITDYVTNSETLAPENFFEGNVNTTIFEDRYYGVPWYTETRALYYRTDLLESVGYPEGPANWEELHDAAIKLSERGDNMYGFSVELPEQSYGFMFARQNGSPLIEDGKAYVNQPEFVEAIEYLHSFVEAGAAANMDLGLDVAQTFGGDGIVPMFISGPWMISIINENAPDIEGNWAVRTLPEGPVNNISNTGGANLAVWNGSDNVDAAIQLIDYMLTPESLLTFYETSSSLPAREVVWEENVLQEEHISAFGEQLENSEHMPLITQWDAVAQAYLSAYEQIMVGGADIQTTLDQLNGEIESLIQ